MIRSAGTVDAIILSGDIANRGSAAEFILATDQLRRLTDSVADLQDRPPVVVVPGNHDLERQGDDALSELSLAAPNAFEAAVNEALKSGGSSLLAPVHAAFGAFAHWIETCDLLARPVARGAIPGDAVYSIQGNNGLRVAFIGLNTSFSQLRDGDYDGALTACDAQIDALYAGLAAMTDLPETAIVVSHHPLSWLQAKSRTMVRELVVNGPLHPVGHLFGHRHERDLSARTPNGVDHFLEMQTSSFFGLEQFDDRQDRIHGYSILAVEEQDGYLSGRIAPRLAVETSEGRWAFDRDTSAGLSLLKGSDFTDRVRLRSIGRHRAPAITRSEPEHAIPALGDHAAGAKTREVVGNRLREVQDMLLVASPWGDRQTIWDDPRSDVDGLARPVGLIDRLLEGPDGATDAEALFVGASILLGHALRRVVLLRLPFFSEWLDSGEWAREVASVSTTYERLFARARRSRGVEPEIIGSWLQRSAIAGSDVPWRIPEAVALATKVANVLERRPGEIETIAEALLRVSRHAAFGRVGKGSVTAGLLAGGVSTEAGAVDLVRASHVEPFAVALSAMIFDSGLDGQELVEQVGLTPAFDLEQAMGEIWAAEWTLTSTGGPAVVCRCTDPAVELAINAMCTRLRTRRDHLGEGVAAQAIRDGLLNHLRTDAVGPRVRDSVAVYESPIPRLTMNTERVRELLMGEQLYGDARLALREVYQNALDACRYREKREAFLSTLARQLPWSGEISLELTEIHSGHSVLECTDNGVGMDKAKMTGSFLRAGERFVESPEFVEEQLRWRERDPSVTLVPNSTFGIGAYSYFMIADRVEVFSRPQNEQGDIGELVHLNLIAGSTIARVRVVDGESETLMQGGTLVRFHLRPEYASGARLTLKEFLDDTVWVSPFTLSITERAETFVRAPQSLSATAPPGQAVAFDDGDSVVWWSVRDSRLLADGIRTPVELVGMTANLHGDHKPLLRVDRNAVVSWEQEWLLETLSDCGETLLAWDYLNLAWLWRVAEAYPILGKQLTDVIVRERPVIPLGLSRAWTEVVDLRKVGCFPADRYLLSPLRESSRHGTAYPDIPLPKAKVFEDRHWGPNIKFPTCIRPWRRAVWRDALPVLFDDWKPRTWGLTRERARAVAEPKHVERSFTPDPVDAALMASQPEMTYGWDDDDHGEVTHVDLVALTFGAHRCGVSLGEAVARLARFAEFGLRDIPTLSRGSEDYVPSRGDALVMATLGSTFVSRKTVTRAELLELLPLCQEARTTLGDGVSQATEILERFGVRVPRMASLSDGLGEHVPTQRDVEFFGFSWTRHGYELRDAQASRSMVLRAARRAAIYDEDAVRRLLKQYAPFGVSALARRFRYPDLGRFSEEQRVAWSENFDGRPSWVDEDVYGRGYFSAQVPPAEEVSGHGIFYSAFSGAGLRTALETVFGFPGLTVSPGFDFADVDDRPVDDVDLKVLRRRIGRQSRYRSERFEGMGQTSLIRRRLTPYEAVLASQEADIPVSEVFSRLERFSFLGTAPPECDPTSIMGRELSPIELKMVTSKDPRFSSESERFRFPDDEPEPIEGPIPGAHLFLVARAERISLAETWGVMEGLAAMGFESSAGPPPPEIRDLVPSESDADLAAALELDALGRSLCFAAQGGARTIGELCRAASGWAPWVFGLQPDSPVLSKLGTLERELEDFVPSYEDCVLLAAIRHDVDTETVGVARIIELAAEMGLTVAETVAEVDRLAPFLHADGMQPAPIPASVAAIAETPSWTWLLTLGLAGPPSGATRGRLAGVVETHLGVLLDASTVPLEVRDQVA